MRRFRTLNKWYAWFFGYFWIRCPMCGNYFGGHEHGHSTLNNKILCWRCPAGVNLRFNRETGYVIDAIILPDKIILNKSLLIELLDAS